MFVDSFGHCIGLRDWMSIAHYRALPHILTFTFCFVLHIYILETIWENKFSHFSLQWFQLFLLLSKWYLSFYILHTLLPYLLTVPLLSSQKSQNLFSFFFFLQHFVEILVFSFVFYICVFSFLSLFWIVIYECDGKFLDCFLCCLGTTFVFSTVRVFGIISVYNQLSTLIMNKVLEIA